MVSGGDEWSPKGAHDLIPRTDKDMPFHGKGTLQIGLSVGPWDDPG